MRDTPALVRFAGDRSAGVVQVIATVFAEYGMTFDLPDFDADLKDIETSYRDPGGDFWLLLEGDRVVGTVGVVPKDASSCELKRLYLLSEYRGGGHGRRLIEHVIGWAAGRDYRTIVAWSDVRLETAHRVYRRLGFETLGQRTVDDIDRSREYGFRFALAGPAGPRV